MVRKKIQSLTQAEHFKTQSCFLNLRAGKSGQDSEYRIRYRIMIFSPLSSQFRINFCKNLQKIYCINSVLYSKCLPCTKNAISRLTSGPQKSFTTLFSPDRHRKKAQYSFYHKNLEKGNKITNNEGYRFFGTPCTMIIFYKINGLYTNFSNILEIFSAKF